MSKFGLINARSTVATITASPFVPPDTSFENVSIPSAATTIQQAAETSALAATQIPLADDDTVNESCKFGGDLPSGLRFVQWNARSVYRKTDKLQLIMGNSKREADVLGITDTCLIQVTVTVMWLSTATTSSEETCPQVKVGECLPLRQCAIQSTIRSRDRSARGFLG